VRKKLIITPCLASRL